jgi:protein-disulfide isomerase
MDNISAWIKKTDKRLLAGGGVALALLLGGGVYFYMSQNKIEEAVVVDADCVPKTEVVVTDEDYIIGDKNAPVTLVEYLSQTCSHCAEFRANEIPKIEESFVKNGKLRIVFRELHRNNIDIAASVLGRCLGRDGFLPFTDMLLENQQSWMMREDQNIVEGLREMARRAGMSSGDFETCLKNQDLAKKLAEKSQADAKDYCITGTPTLLLNGRKLEGIDTAYVKLDAAIREEMKKAGVEVPPAAAAETPAEGAAAPAEGAPAEGTPAEAVPAEGAAPAAEAPASPPSP